MTSDSYESLFTRIKASDGCGIAYRVLNDRSDGKVPLVMLMGLTGISLDWEHFATALSASRPVILMDNRGIGASCFAKADADDGPSSISLDRMARDVLDVVNAYRGSLRRTAAQFSNEDALEFDLLGLSMGGMIAQTVARLSVVSSASQPKQPKLRKLILMATTARSLVGHTALTPEVLTPHPNDTKMDVSRRMMKLNLPPNFDAAYPERFEEICALAVQGVRPFGVVFAQARAIGRLNGFIDGLKEIRVPTLVVHGTEDAVIPVRFGDELAEVLGGFAEYMKVEGGGHLVFEDGMGGKDVVKRVVGFLDSPHKLGLSKL
ncbi:hypothetical protein HDU77_004943 [Chytriomyces hyalinus]|nr:hypothetical protein HDU77_004943 [Chytriomyces hyalinus]